MRLSINLVSCLVAASHAAPTWPSLNFKELANPFTALDSLSGYFNLVASKVESARVISIAPTCDFSKARMPTVDGLPPPSPGMKLSHVAVGRGTQNYTCDASKPDEAPKAVGAVAVLYNVTCTAAMYPDVAEKIPNMAVHFQLDDEARLGPVTMPVSGHHYFTSKGVPFFNLVTDSMNIGQVPCAKNSSAPAPSTASAGQVGDAAVPWLKLTSVEGVTGNIKEIFRVVTAGGSAPKTCKGQPNTIQVEYAAQYWFWER